MSDAAVQPSNDGCDLKDSQPLNCLASNGSPTENSSEDGSSTVRRNLHDAEYLRRTLEREANGRAALQRLQNLDREAFRLDLAKWLLGAPSIEQIAAYAAKNPDRWAQGLAVMARLSGYTERPEEAPGSTSLFASITKISDADLLARLTDIDAKLGALAGQHQPETIETAEFREVPADPLADLL